MDARNVIIIGSGPAGYTAAIYAARAMLQPILISGRELGGQLMLTSEVENWPGEPTGIMGPELMEKLKKQAERFGTEMYQDVVTSVDLSAAPYKVTTETGKEFSASAIIIATGASAKWLHVGEERLHGRGVSACATCDGFFFRGKEVVVVGGGDSAMEEATFLTRFANKVTVVHRSQELRASKIMVERAKQNPKIEFILDSAVTGVVGEDRLTAVKIKNIVTGEESEYKADGLFVAIGHKPNTDLFQGRITVDQKGYIVTENRSTKTNIPGVFACGDVMDATYRQAVTAAGTGCMAALEVERFLAH
ncbi:thioredoxin-disulfide reductase [Patescibacteria group bacterium]|nr:thioredoxin-disulfide reductase [Patescibacteria group bacterium]